MPDIFWSLINLTLLNATFIFDIQDMVISLESTTTKHQKIKQFASQRADENISADLEVKIMESRSCGRWAPIHPAVPGDTGQVCVLIGWLGSKVRLYIMADLFAGCYGPLCPF